MKLSAFEPYGLLFAEIYRHAILSDRALRRRRYPAASQPSREHDLCPDYPRKASRAPAESGGSSRPFPEKLNPENGSGSGSCAPLPPSFVHAGDSLKHGP